VSVLLHAVSSFEATTSLHSVDSGPESDPQHEARLLQLPPLPAPVPLPGSTVMVVPPSLSPVPPSSPKVTVVESPHAFAHSFVRHEASGEALVSHWLVMSPSHDVMQLESLQSHWS